MHYCVDTLNHCAKVTASKRKQLTGNKMSESKISTNEVLNGGTIELWKIEGFFYVKSIVAGVVKFSDIMCKFSAEYLVFDAMYYGKLDF